MQTTYAHIILKKKRKTRRSRPGQLSAQPCVGSVRSLGKSQHCLESSLWVTCTKPQGVGTGAKELERINERPFTRSFLFLLHFRYHLRGNLFLRRKHSHVNLQWAIRFPYPSELGRG